MQGALSEIQESPLFEAAQISTTEVEQLEAVWARFLEASFELDMLKNRHR